MAAVFAVLWTGLILFMCAQGINEIQESGLMDTTGGAAGAGIGVMLYGAIWIGGLMVIALFKFIFGGKK